MTKATAPAPEFTEATVAAAAIAHLAPSWAEYWVEVPSETGRVDVVGRDSGGGLHAVEVKLGASLALAGQCCNRIHEGAFKTVLAVVGSKDTSGRNYSKVGDDLAPIAREVGFGLMVITLPAMPDEWTHKHIDNWRERMKPRVRLLAAPRELPVREGADAIVAAALNDIHRACASDAGSPGSKYWTLWKQGIHDLEEAVAKKPGGGPREYVHDMKEFSNALYWQNATQQVRKMAESSDKLVITVAKGRLVYHLKVAA